MQLRKIKQNDLTQYVALYLEALKTCPTTFYDDYDIESEKANHLHLQYISDNIVVGAFNSNDLIGMIVLELKLSNPKAAHSANIAKLYVTPKYRGKGVGSLLIDHIISIAKNLVKKLVLIVGSNNQSAIQAYRCFGFKQFGYSEKSLYYDGKFYDEILMHKFI